jgi:sodium-dependent dicarboxylate transporter 2/3/5
VEELAATPRVRRVGLIAGPALAGLMLALPVPADLSPAGWQIAALGVLMAVWWMTEALPLAATALLPLALLPLPGIRPLEEVAADYAHPLIFLFLGGFMLARALHVRGLDRRLALGMLRTTGARPDLVIGGIMLVTAFLSMWVSNTATAMVMLPIAQSLVVTLAGEDRSATAGFAPALLLGVAYAATIGGMGTLIGTPPNALFAAFMAESYGVEIGFSRWLLIGLPLVIVLLPLTWLVLTRIAFRVGHAELHGARAAIAGAHDALGPMTSAEKRIAALMLLAAAAWVFRPLLADLLPGLPLSDAGIAVSAALLLFLLPDGSGENRRLLSWSEAAGIRWDVLILFGGGLALAGAIAGTDLAAWLGARLAGAGALPLVLLLLLLGLVLVFVGELASNTAMAAVFLPVAGATAVGMGEPALLLALPVALFATLGFMLPVATPPNAIVFGSGAVSARHMLRAGILLDLVGIVVVAVAVLTLGRWVFGAV